MVMVEARTHLEKLRFASVGILDKNSVPVYEEFIPPPRDYHLNMKHCLVTDQ